jgi:bifunctional UDP-N-acetylglucosamine pyrophosphorylase/glucosamine-1-phosphate N-acetyltransferase
MTTELPKKITALLDKGVSIPCPSAVVIGDEVRMERISAQGTVLHAGTRLAGAKTLIGPGAKIGFESPVTLVDCRLGSGVELKGGFFTGSVFLARASMGSGAQVREGCLIEEEASGAHTVGLKQTILFPFVTLGSLINFCDCLMAGGMSRKDHSEVGSSYIHFNYTPNQDKATASLIGDVPRGVMLRQTPIFLGGQGGLVGPVRLGYGTVIAAGTVWEDDCPQGGMLLKGSALRSERPLHPGLYREVRRKVVNNLLYIGNLAALRQWYVHVRKPFLKTQEGGAELCEGALEVLEAALEERISRLRALAAKMEGSIAVAEKVLQDRTKEMHLRHKRELLQNWPEAEKRLSDLADDSIGEDGRGLFMNRIDERLSKGAGGYIDFIRALDRESADAGSAWLQSVVDAVVSRALEALPSFRG